MSNQIIEVLEKLEVIKPEPESGYQHILNSMMSHVVSNTPVADINQGSVIHTLLEAMAKETEKLNARIDDLI